ncbi:hypothetical protein AGMMS50293_30720 [Spirochaetia bacterium]|nr:hypothetical protein AGMMS50293_30720 [Spirochaetia bacterium]
MKIAKKITAAACIALAVLIAAACGSSPQAAAAPVDETKTLRVAIQEAADLIEERLPEETKVALLNFSSPSDQFSEYVLEELSSILVNNGRLIIVDRKEIDLIRSETNFQWSGEVSDASAQEIGQMIGAQSILSGSLSSMGDIYRFMVKVLNVQTARVEVQYPAEITADSRVKTMLASGKAPAPAPRQTAGGTAAAQPAASSGGGTAASGGSREQPAPIVVERAPAPAQAAPLKNGTYTFYPRLRAMQGGVDKNAYLDRIVIRSGYLTIYLVNVPQAKGRRAQGEWAEIYTNKNDIILQDLDRPTRTWNVTANGDDDVTGGQYLTFQGVTATRFSLTRKSNPDFVFDEIILGQPD